MKILERKSNKTMSIWVSKRSLFIGIILALPFLIANFLVRMEAEFFLSFIRPSGQTTNFEQHLVLALIALVGVGGIVALLPMLKDKRIYLVNMIVGVVFVVFTIHAGYGIGYDFYKCDVLKIPNCD